MRALPWLSLVLVACGARTELEVGSSGSGDGGAAGTGGFGGEGPGGGGSGTGGQGVGGVEQMALGAGHTCLRTFEGDVYCWGRNGDGQLGIGTTDDALTPSRVPLDRPATFLAAGTYHTCAGLDDGRTFCWGKDASGQLGVAGDGGDVLSPAELALALPAHELALGEAHSCGVFGAEGERALYCWGGGADGQTGGAGSTNVPALVVSGATSVAAGAFHSCFTDAAGTVLCMGTNFDGECGVVGPPSTSTPVVPLGLEGLAVRGLRSGRGHHTCGIVSTSVVCWGDNDGAQLGLGFASENDLPGNPLGAPPLEPVSVAPGFNHTCALYGDEVHCFGSNSSGQLGSSGGDHPTPTLVPGLSGVVAVGTGTLHSCAYVSPVEIYCWGGNDFGQLGDGSTTTSTTPVLAQLPN